ncbi:MAG: glycosyltransferase family 4 protein [Candidatus Thorarchaeota archaeon]
MNILLITDDFYPNQGGIAHTLRCMCKSFKETKHKLFIINPFYKGKDIYNILKFKNYSLSEAFKFILNKTSIYYLIYSILAIIRDKKIKLSERVNLVLYLFTKPKLLLNSIYNVRKISPYFNKSNIDLILTANSGWILPSAFILSRIYSKPLVSMTHGVDFLVLSYFSLKHFYFKNVDMFILSNTWIERLFNKIHKINKTRIINRGIIVKELEVNESKEGLRAEFNLSGDTFVLFSVGRQIKRKNFDLAIRAVKEIKIKVPNIKIKYFLIGEGPMTKNLKELTRQLNLAEDVIFLGFQDIHIRNKFYKLADVFLMPAITEKNSIEGFGIVFIEANFYKIPSIGSYSGGMRQAIINGETGFLIKPNSLEDLTEKILILYRNVDLRKKMGEIGHNRVLKSYCWREIINEYIKVFEEVIN